MIKKSRFVLFCLLYLLWLGLVWPPDVQHALIGIIVAVFVAFMTGHMFVDRPHVFKHAPRYLWFLYYLLLFAWDYLKACIDICYRAIHPLVPVNSGIVKVKTSLSTDTAITFLSNTITLTGPTLSVDVDREKGIIYVHWLDVQTQDMGKATEKIVKRFEKILAKIFE